MNIYESDGNEGGMLQTPQSTHEQLDSLEFNSQVDSDANLDMAGRASSVGTGQMGSYISASSHVADATETVHEMHLALMYLLSNPDEFERALASSPAQGATTLAEWNAEYDTETEASLNMTDTMASQTHDQALIPSTTTSAGSGSSNTSTPLPFVVFADDAEVVLPQAHTASQLFGLERLEGIELEAAAGIRGISQLFLRWLALMPGADHLNIIDPPGLTVMRIAGGRYRVTAAHRVIWTWMNEFAPLSLHDDNSYGDIRGGYNDNDGNANGDYESIDKLQVGDLVTMTIVDVFETDSRGKLLSYCPTFDNRAVYKTHQTAEVIRKGSTKFIHMLHQARKSKLAAVLLRNAKNVAWTVQKQLDAAVNNYNNSPKRTADGRTAIIPEEEEDDDDGTTTSGNNTMAGETTISSKPDNVSVGDQTADVFSGLEGKERHEV